MLLDILLYLLCDTRCAAWLRVSLELGLEVFVSVILVCGYSCCNAPQCVASCRNISPICQTIRVKIETRRTGGEGKRLLTCWSYTTAYSVECGMPCKCQHCNVAQDKQLDRLLYNTTHFPRDSR